MRPPRPISRKKPPGPGVRDLRIVLIHGESAAMAQCAARLAPAIGIQVIGEFDRGEEACAAYRSLAPDVVISGLHSPGFGGMSTLRRLLVRDAAAKVLVIGTENAPVAALIALNNGARGYLTWSDVPTHLVDAIRAVATEHSRFFLCPPTARDLALSSLDTSELEARFASLSPREFDLFGLLARGMTARETAREFQIAPQTAANYAAAVRRKLQAKTAADLALLAYQHRLLSK